MPSLASGSSSTERVGQRLAHTLAAADAPGRTANARWCRDPAPADAPGAGRTHGHDALHREPISLEMAGRPRVAIAGRQLVIRSPRRLQALNDRRRRVSAAPRVGSSRRVESTSASLFPHALPQRKVCAARALYCHLKRADTVTSTDPPRPGRPTGPEPAFGDAMKRTSAMTPPHLPLHPKRPENVCAGDATGIARPMTLGAVTAPSELRIRHEAVRRGLRTGWSGMAPGVNSAIVTT